MCYNCKRVLNIKQKENQMKNKAFTLAETLIVIGIIGVVAALTLPNLNHATGDKEKVTKVKKIYSALNEAFDRAQAIYGDYDTWCNDCNFSTKTELTAKRITEFMKISKDCGLTTNAGCFSQSTANKLNGDQASNLDSAFGYSSAYRVITSDNMSILFAGCYNGIDNFATFDVLVDIDGPNKGKNTYGHDLFQFRSNDKTNMIEPYGKKPSTPVPAVIINDTFKYGVYAAYWIIEADNADYLKADSTGKCNGSDIVLDVIDWSNISCH